MRAIEVPLGLLQFDAHPDAAESGSWGAPLHHGSWVRLAIEQGWIDPTRTLQIGLRAPRHNTQELSFLQKAGVRFWGMLDLKSPRKSMELAGDLRKIGDGPAYISLDMDVLDPAFAPAVSEPVPGGLSVLDVLALLQHARSWPSPWVGADVVEVAPQLPGGEETARVAAHLALHLLNQ